MICMNDLCITFQIENLGCYIEACGKGWHDELRSVLWSIHTTATKPTGETPFFVVYGAEVVLPHEVRHRSARVLAFYEA